jgi:hypothetical protein
VRGLPRDKMRPVDNYREACDGVEALSLQTSTCDSNSPREAERQRTGADILETDTSGPELMRRGLVVTRAKDADFEFE